MSTIYPNKETFKKIMSVLKVEDVDEEEFAQRFENDFKHNIKRNLVLHRARLSCAIRKAAHSRLGIWLNSKDFKNESELRTARDNQEIASLLEYRRRLDSNQKSLWHGDMARREFNCTALIEGKCNETY
jgi:hypothetical protein